MFLKLFDSVKITKGRKNSIIFDTSTGFLKFIPKSLFDLLSNEKQDYLILKNKLDNKSSKILNEYIEFILKNRLGFIVNSKKELSNFHNLSYFNVNFPEIEYLIIDINKLDILKKHIYRQIFDLNIKYLQIRLSEQLTANKIKKIILKLSNLNTSNINEISIVLKFDLQILSFIEESHFKISNKYLSFVLYSAEIDDLKITGDTKINIIKNKIRLPLSCGLIDLKNVNLNQFFYLESHHHNSCLHKKISIDAEGNIRNCPSMPESFGNIKNTTLEEALNHKDFKKYWNLTKDKIEVCKDCEFRYICTDCRAYTERTHEDKEGLDVSKPLKCGYNPYTGEWQDWSTNPLKQKAIKYYGMEEMIKN